MMRFLNGLAGATQVQAAPSSPSPSLNDLPEDILIKIGRMVAVDTETLEQLGQVNSAWRARTNPLWQRHWEALHCQDPTVTDPPRQAKAAYQRWTATLRYPPSLAHSLGHTSWVSAVALTGNTVVTGSWDRTARLWDATSGALRQTLVGHTRSVHAVALAGNTVVTGSRDRTACLWDARSGALLQTLAGHTGPVSAVALAGNTVVTGSEDCTAKVWVFKPNTARLSISSRLFRFFYLFGVG